MKKSLKTAIKPLEITAALRCMKVSKILSKHKASTSEDSITDGSLDELIAKVMAV